MELRIYGESTVGSKDSSVAAAGGEHDGAGSPHWGQTGGIVGNSVAAGAVV
jgi:hypothetical protein